MGRRVQLIGGLAAAIASLALAAVPASAGAATFLAGAGVESTTPPAPGSPADQQFGANSPACTNPPYTSRGRFGLQEPFADTNNNLQWDEGPQLEAFCDANSNGRWDGIYADNGKGPATGVHDPLEARAFAISDGQHKPVVYASVAQIGIFDYYTDLARADLATTYGVNADLVVSANHNESSPDSIGLYGAYSAYQGIGLRSGIDEYFMSFLADRVAHAAADAVHAMRPANLYAAQVEGHVPDGTSGSSYPLLSGMSQRISDQFPTSVALPGDDRVAAIDTKLGVLQARTADKSNTPIFTVASLAAHNQEMGNAGAMLSSDWPGAFQHAFDAANPGTAIFLVGDNGSEEDPQTSPPVIPNGSENHSNPDTQFIQAQATGEQLAKLTQDAASAGQQLRAGPVTLTRKQICVPLENNGFAALAANGEFGKRQGWACDANGNPVAALPNGPTGATASNDFRTFIGYTNIGPDLQLIDNPGEAFPALMLGSPFGVSDESCNRPNPQVPTWHANALYRFQVGLADDLIGYLIPAWGFASGTPGLFNNDTCYQDMNGHRHKLESESVGPTGANDVANGLSDMLKANPDPTAQVVQGRFVRSDGSLSRWPTGAVGALLEPGNVLVGDPTTAGFGGRAVDQSGVFMDYDGEPQPAPDVTTRGIMVFGSNGCVSHRYYLDVFPNLSNTPSLGGVTTQPPVLPVQACPYPDVQPIPAAQTGLPLTPGQAQLVQGAGPFAVHHPHHACTRRLRRPRIVFSHHHRRVRVFPGRCGKQRARIARVTIALRGRHRQRLIRHKRHFTLPGGHRHWVIRVFDTNGLKAVRVS